MTKRAFPRWLLLFALLGMITACSRSVIKPVDSDIEMDAPARDVIAQVREQAAEVEDSIEVQPLRDPLVIDLRDTATEYEKSGDFAAADEALKQALLLVPDNPELLQWRAELALAMGRLDDAVQLANTSWELGPRLGKLCRRNWAAIQMARELSQLPEAAAVAAAQAERCTVTPPIRM